MKKHIMIGMVVLILGVGILSGEAAPVRVVVLGFDNETGLKSDPALGGQMNIDALASKGIYLLSQQILRNSKFELVDRRDYMRQMKRQVRTDEGALSSVKPAYLDAARALGADILLRGSLLAFSTGKRVIDQGGQHVEFADVSMSVAVQAQSVMDGSVIASETGSADLQIRQTDNVKTVLSESNAMQLMNKALAQAVPRVSTAIEKKLKEIAAQPKIALPVDSTDNPAMVEIDGVLVGSTPIEKLSVFKGDHVFHISRPGYESITKRINLQKDTLIKVPMLRTDLTAAEKAKILESSEIKQYISDGKPDLVIQTIE